VLPKRGIYRCNDVFRLLNSSSGEGIFRRAEVKMTAIKWDYESNPMQVTENHDPPFKEIGLAASSAFDGYGAQGSQPACVRAWYQDMIPTDTAPLVCTIDYSVPVMPTAFVHYCYVPGSRDLRFTSPVPSAFRRLKIYASKDGESWQEIAYLADLPADCPQLLPVPESDPARYWRLEVLELVEGAEMLCSYEIETYTGGVPEILVPDLSWPDLPDAFRQNILTSMPFPTPDCPILALKEDGLAVDLSAGAISGELQLIVDEKPVKLQVSPHNKGEWKGSVDGGEIVVQYQETYVGALLELSFCANENAPVKYRKTTLHMTAAKVDLYYMPAYVWNREPVDIKVLSANVQTRFASLGIGECMLCLVPGTDRGNLGFTSGAACNELLLGSEPTPVLITAVPGDWWQAYQFVVKEVYEFREQPQTVPVSEMQAGISRYLLTDEVWEPTLGTLRSWPEHDPHYQLYGFDSFGFYGATYSIPAFLAYHAMTGNKLALERARSIAHWLCRSGVRMQTGTTKGAFFSAQRFPKGEAPRFDKQGRTQANTAILTSHATGAALWTLLLFRRMQKETKAEIDETIIEAAEWLMKSQADDGGWPYGHDVDGTPVGAASSSGSIWNIWALWRLGKATGNAEYLESAERAIRWYAQSFIEPHHYHGYWEDVGPDCREGYEAALATVAFAEMGRDDLAVAAARDAMQWVFTRQIECRDADNSAGLVAEQTGWPPGHYCVAMMALAAWNAWQITGDDFWRAFALTPKAMGWWYQRETGAMLWIVDSIQMAPVVGPSFRSWWPDWCNAQTATLGLRWLIREVNRQADGAVTINEETLQGVALSQSVRVWAPEGGFRLILPQHGQVNWLGLRGNDRLFLVLLDYGADGPITIHMNYQDAKGAALWPLTIHNYYSDAEVFYEWDGQMPVDLPASSITILEWGIAQ
jgi:hypothetical protein